MDAKIPTKVVKVNNKKVTTETDATPTENTETTPVEAKVLKKVSLAQEREQFFVYDALESNGIFNDEHIIAILGIKNTIQEQIEKRDAMLESDKFIRFKEWKKLKLKTPKVAKVAKTVTKKVGTSKKFLNFEKVQIPADKPDAPWYYQAHETLKGELGPRLFFDKEHLKAAGFWVNNMIVWTSI